MAELTYINQWVGDIQKKGSNKVTAS